LPSGIDGHRALAGDPAIDVLIRLPVSYQYHQRHAASFPRLCRRRGHRPLRRHCVGAGAKSPFLSVLREARQYSLVENRYMIPYYNADSALTLSCLLYTMRVTLQRRLLVLLLSSLILSACARRVPSVPTDGPVLSTARGAQLQGTVVALSTRRVLAFDAFVEAVAQAQVVAVGEEHYHPDIQAFELRLLQALAQRRPQCLALAMEFLERDMQPAVDAYLAGTSDAATFQERIKATPLFIQYYFPLVQYAQQAHIPVLAMNTPRTLARRVSKEGLQAVVQNVPDAERAHLPATFSAITPQYRAYFLKAVAASHPLPEAQIERFVEAAQVKDDTMATSLAVFLERAPDCTVLAIAGRFHFEYGLAIPALLQQRRPHVTMQRVTTMTVAADETIPLSALAREHLADYVWFAPPRPETRTQN